MNIHCQALEKVTDHSSQQLITALHQCIEEHLPTLESEFVQDMSHISQAAIYSGNLSVDKVEFLKDNLFRCEYSYDWQIGWTCSGTQEEGRVNEKVRFSLEPDGSLKFKFLKLEF